MIVQVLIVVGFVLSLLQITYLCFFSPVAKFPGPILCRASRWYMASLDFLNLRLPYVLALHEKHGPIVRIGPNELHVASDEALKVLSGARTHFIRTAYYTQLFQAGGRHVMLSFPGVLEHNARKKKMARFYTNSAARTEAPCGAIEDVTSNLIKCLASQEQVDVIRQIHYFAADWSSRFFFGTYGATNMLDDNENDRRMLDDILDPWRDLLFCAQVHFPGLVDYIYKTDGWIPQYMKRYLPPFTYDGIRAHTLASVEAFYRAGAPHETDHILGAISEKWADDQEVTTDMIHDIAAEISDHYLASCDPLPSRVIFVIRELSKEENKAAQTRLIHEVCNTSVGHLDRKTSTSLVYLAAVIKESLRLHQPPPEGQPRVSDRDEVLHGQLIPAGTTVVMSPYTFHRYKEAFVDPHSFNPERWLDSSSTQMEIMNKYLAPFARGERACIGQQ